MLLIVLLLLLFALFGGLAVNPLFFLIAILALIVFFGSGGRL